ncbi:MAG TPA: hypothetical protein VHK91_11560, partial [Flavisolibacter sp.]|nr:hypothetical protein [Flavisolibacter sp.]
MKNVFSLLIAGVLFSATASAQSTVDSIAAKYKLQPMPEALTIEKTFPVLGSYQLNNSGAATASTDATMSSTGVVTITLDSSNKGIVWIEGLPQGKMKAYLKQSPSTYRILAQKTESGKQVPEGTLMLDTTSKTLNIALGKAYDEQDPTGIFALNSTSSNAAMAPEDGTEVKVKTKTPTSKTKSK